MPKHLVIVESPTKAKTLRRYLGDDFIVESSVGHVRDLPTKKSEVPAAYQKESWAKLGVNVDDDFKPIYVVHPDKKSKITELKKLLKGCDTLYLATDEDREGEAISWHLLELLKPKVPVKRMVFHEITRSAIEAALEDTRDIDSDMVQAQEARRIIDRLYGFEVSQMLWRKIAQGLSAGRVQSVAIKILVERERARMRFTAAEYWDLNGLFGATDGEFKAALRTIGGRPIAQGRDFDPDTGKLKKDKVVLLDAASAASLRDQCGRATFMVSSAEEKPFTRNPAAPFTTSTLQQEGNRKLRFDAKRTMRAAQRLYESGFITYMRTDSVNLSKEAVSLARAAVVDAYGENYLSPEPRTFKGKVKNAQEAHEAIRPAGDRVRTVAEVAQKLGSDEARVYELVWKRTLACQMAQARGRRMVVDVSGTAVDGEGAGREVVFRASGSVIDFHGFLRAYVEGSDDPSAALADKDVILPHVEKGQTLTLREMDAESHTTSPPARLTEATLVKTLEESGIGRPSTYASIIETILNRSYSFRKGSALVPTFTAFAVVKLMSDHLPELVDYEFTAKMEDRLDSIARGEGDPLPYLKEFYFGDARPGLRPMLDKSMEHIDPRTVCTIPLGTGEDGREIAVRVGRYGPYLQRDDENGNVPEGTCPDELSIELAGSIIDAAKKAGEPIGIHPDNGEPVFVKAGRYGPYVQLGQGSKEKGAPKPKMVSLLKGMEPADVTFEVALELLQLPRPLGADAEGKLIEANIGRYGPYVKRGSDYRSLEATDDVLTVDLERALALLAQEKRSRGGRAAAEPIKVFENVELLGGVDIKVLKGRYGPYVTDGEFNGSLPRDYADPTALTLEEALDLIAAAKARGPSKRRKKAGRKSTKKAAKKTTKKASKKAAKKSTKKTAKKAVKKTAP
jgi:DNA topoisomerase-1